MNDHELPTDPSDWPTDPHKLLGVGLGTSPRDLKRAYHALIRRYKPEHSPVEFQLIRRAYEALSELGPRSVDPAMDFDVWAASIRRSESKPLAKDFTPRRPSNRESSLDLEEDFWAAACLGETERSYQGLRDRLNRSPGREMIYVQLYWLLTVDPDLDPARSPIDWLIDGLIASPGRCSTARELLRRAIEADPASVWTPSLSRLLEPNIRVDLLVDFAKWRWRAAKQTEQRPDVVLDDLNRLRPRSSGPLEDLWPQLLLAAASTIAWSKTPVAGAFKTLFRELEDRSHSRNDLADELLGLEYLQALTEGRRTLAIDSELAKRLFTFLPTSWDEPFAEISVRVRPLLTVIANHPSAALSYFDALLRKTPEIVGHLAHIFDRLTSLRPDPDDPRGPQSVADPIRRFLNSHPWWNYPVIRPSLLAFFLIESIPPEMLAAFLQNNPDFVDQTGNHISNLIGGDWAIRYVYRACDLARTGGPVIVF